MGAQGPQVGSVPHWSLSPHGGPGLLTRTASEPDGIQGRLWRQSPENQPSAVREPGVPGLCPVKATLCMQPPPYGLHGADKHWAELGRGGPELTCHFRSPTQTWAGSPSWPPGLSPKTADAIRGPATPHYLMCVLSLFRNRLCDTYFSQRKYIRMNHLEKNVL